MLIDKWDTAKNDVTHTCLVISLLLDVGLRQGAPHSIMVVLPIVTTLRWAGALVITVYVPMDCVVYTGGAAAHLSDKTLIAVYDTHGHKLKWLQRLDVSRSPQPWGVVRTSLLVYCRDIVGRYIFKYHLTDVTSEYPLEHKSL